MDDLTVQDILEWIIAHRTDEDAMDEINHLSWQYTKRFREMQEAKRARYQQRPRTYTFDRQDSTE